jgi:hypothetical protein
VITPKPFFNCDGSSGRLDAGHLFVGNPEVVIEDTVIARREHTGEQIQSQTTDSVANS